MVYSMYGSLLEGRTFSFAVVFQPVGVDVEDGSASVAKACQAIAENSFKASSFHDFVACGAMSIGLLTQARCICEAARRSETHSSQ